tara:strand:+ start:64 stop:489 length:426 start_codon:yes stop_codon:yes gene_type:complete
MKTITDFLQVVLDQSHQALKKNEIPVGAVIYDPKKMILISKAHNKELSSNDPTSHAEILCIRKACKKLNQKRLDGFSMITYLEPCDMCKEVIKSSRIKEVKFIFENQNPKRKTIKKILFEKLKANEENLVKLFFKKKRISN